MLIQATGGGGGVNFGAATTRALAATAVPVIAALLAQRYMVRALSLGAVRDRQGVLGAGLRDAGIANASSTMNCCLRSRLAGV